MKILAYQLFIIFLFFSCAPDQKKTEPVKASETKDIEGSWRLVFASTREKDSIQVKDLAKTKFIKIINKQHFAFFNQDEGSSSQYVAGGGSYTFDGENYTETLDFFANPKIRGHEFPFKVEIKGDSLIQQGHEKLEEAGLDRYIVEKYIRIKE